MALEPESLLAQLYLAIVARITATVPEIKWKDLDYGQLETYQVRPAVQFPCVLIDFPALSYRDESQGVQWVDVQVNIRLAFAPFGATNDAAPEESKVNGLAYLELEHKLYSALQGFDADGCIQPLTRLSAATEGREDTFRVRSILMSTATEDDSASTIGDGVKPGLDLSTEFQ